MPSWAASLRAILEYCLGRDVWIFELAEEAEEVQGCGIFFSEDILIYFHFEIEYP